MTLKISYVLACLCVPNFDIVFHESSREKNCWIHWIETDSSYNRFVTHKLQLHHIFWLIYLSLSFQIIKIWCNQNFYYLIIRTCSNQAAGSTPIYAINRSIMMLLLLKYHFNAWILRVISRTFSILLDYITKRFKNRLRYLAEFQTSGIGSQDEQLTRIGRKANRTDRLSVK